jgi:hypothetical protein
VSNLRPAVWFPRSQLPTGAFCDEGPIEVRLDDGNRDIFLALGTASARPDAPPLFVPPLAFLQKHFGANYISYKGKVRRWI